MVWEKTVGGVDFDMPTSISVSRDGSYLVGGFTFSFGNGKRDFWLFKLDNAGEVLWSCTQGKGSYEEAYAVLETAENEFVMAGWQNYIERGPYDYYIVKISPGNASDWGSAYLVGGFFLVAIVLVGVFLLAIKLRKKQKQSKI